MIKQAKVCVVAVDIRSTHNVGSLFRSCDGFGADLILVGITPYPEMKNSADPRLPHIRRKITDQIHKTALGAEADVVWQYFETFNEALAMLKKQGFQIAAVEQASSSVPLNQLQVDTSTALVMGREVEGLSEEELASCDAVYEIPMLGNKESFNVAVAAGIALYQASI